MQNQNEMPDHPELTRIQLDGYRPFRDFKASLGALEVLVGANGSGKSSFFEFLKFLRNGMDGEIPPEIISGSIGEQIFHKPGPDKFSWAMDILLPSQQSRLGYFGQLLGPVGRVQVADERVGKMPPEKPEDPSSYYLAIKAGKGFCRGSEGAITPIEMGKINQLALGSFATPSMPILYDLRQYIRRWRFYNSLDLAMERIRNPVPIEEEPALREDAGNLSAVLHYFTTEHRSLMEQVDQCLRMSVPGFKAITVKARGLGRVLAFWKEDGVDDLLSLSDLSDGILRLICWTVLCLHPHPPPLVCVDEPDLGVHPRTLPILAGLFEKATERTQLLLATHASYFLTQFDISRIAVMKKENGEARFTKPKDSKILEENLKEFGPEEIERLHQTDELEFFA